VSVAEIDPQADRSCYYEDNISTDTQHRSGLSVIAKPLVRWTNVC